MELERVRQLVIDCAHTWRESRCSRPWTPAVGPVSLEHCVGENHLEDCPCELARQDLIAALNKLDMLEPR